ncbi:MAG TPA: GNAT family N-acetyltransferase [Syntrophorhabdaceae bacterium]|jgi:ribosomal protein S18 acetylase RimI-like enzyme
MDSGSVRVRLMRADDFDAIVGIDARVLKVPRLEYYRLKFEKFIQSKDYVPTSLVAEDDDGTVVGFIMGELYIGEFGISEAATLDTIGVDPSHQYKGIGQKLIHEYVEHLRSLGIKKMNTLVDENDSRLIHFFKANKFIPSKIVSLERSIES